MWLQRDNHVGDGGDEERLWSLSNGWSPKHILEQPPSQEHFPERPNDFWKSRSCPIKLKFGDIFGLHVFT